MVGKSIKETNLIPIIFKVFVLTVGAVTGFTVVPRVPIIRHQLVPNGTISKMYPLFFRQSTTTEELPATTSLLAIETTDNPEALTTTEESLYRKDAEEETTTTTFNEIEEATDSPEETTELTQLKVLVLDLPLEVDSRISDEVGMSNESQVQGNTTKGIESSSIIHRSDKIEKEQGEKKLENSNVAVEINKMTEKVPNFDLHRYSSAFFHHIANFPFVNIQHISLPSTSSSSLPLIKSYQSVLHTAAFHPFKKITTITTTVEQHHHHQPQRIIRTHDGLILNYTPVSL